MGVFTRGTKLWITYKDADGRWRNKATGLSVGQEKLAQAAFDEGMARIRAAKAGETVIVSGPLTVRAYAETWLKGREELDLDWKNDRGRLKHHILPTIGDMSIADVRSRHIVGLFHKIRTTPRVGRTEQASPRLIYNIYSVCSAMFRDAKLADLIEQTPCELDERQLGPLKDSDPEWRAGAVFTRAEAIAIISDARIPADRHVVYGLELLAGVRPGEAAGLRWRNRSASSWSRPATTRASIARSRRRQTPCATYRCTRRSQPCLPSGSSAVGRRWWDAHRSRMT